MNRDTKKVVITGLGVMSTLGRDIDSFWDNLNAKKSGYSSLPLLDEKQTPFRVGGYLGDINDPEHSVHHRATQLALQAAAQAIEQAGLIFSKQIQKDKTIAVVMGTTCGANDVIETPGFEEHWFSGDFHHCPQEAFIKYDHTSIANAISREYKFCGPSYVVGTACSSGNHAIGEAVNLIQSGQADIVLCGGADAFTLLPVFGFYAMKSLAKEKCTPFDQSREGMILGEGAAVLVLESSHSAKSRNAMPLAEVKAWALNCDAKNFAAPLETGERCEELILACLKAASLQPDDIDYINAHGTGTSTNDLMEARGISNVFVDAQEKTAISSIKGMLGHTLGAAGAFEGVVATLAIQHDRIPPNTAVETMDEGIDLAIITESTSKPLRHVLSLSFAFGGCNVATLFSKT